MVSKFSLESFNLKVTQDISQEKLTALVFVNSWETFNQAAAELFDKIRNNSEFSSKCSIHIIDIEKDFESAVNYGVVIGPSVVLFWKGKQLRIKRRNHEEDNKYVGIAKIEDYQNLLRAAIQDGAKLAPIICDCLIRFLYC